MGRFYLAAGTTVARYELIRPIGSGGCGTVYEAVDTSLGRRVAVKLRPLSNGIATAMRDKARFLREARAAAHVRHPNVIDVFDFGIERDFAFLVMELVEGETLAALLKREGAIGTERALAILLPILSAVTELHAQGVVHRDIKPANVLLGRGDEAAPKLADFGLSRFVEEASALTDSGMTMGTPEYMAPEVTRGSHESTEWSDQYALGVMIYECVTNARPFYGGTTYEVMQSVVHGPVVPPSELESSLPKGFDRVVLRAMHREPCERFESVEQLGAALLPFASEDSAARWQSEVAQSSALSREVSSKANRSTGERPLVHDGVALKKRGDALTVLWKAPARMSRVVWTFDTTDRIAARMPDGIVVLVVLLPSSSPPDAETTVECMRRMRRLRSSMRRQATVAVGGGIWQSVIKHAFSAMMLGRAGRFTISGTFEEGIASLLEKRRPETPSFQALREDVLALHEALDLDAPEIGSAPVGPPSGGASVCRPE
jgi:serine/threonine protein kinase